MLASTRRHGRRGGKKIGISQRDDKPKLNRSVWLKKPKPKRDEKPKLKQDDKPKPMRNEKKLGNLLNKPCYWEGNRRNLRQVSLPYMVRVNGKTFVKKWKMSDK